MSSSIPPIVDLAPKYPSILQQQNEVLCNKVLNTPLADDYEIIPNSPCFQSSSNFKFKHQLCQEKRTGQNFVVRIIPFHNYNDRQNFTVDKQNENERIKREISLQYLTSNHPDFGSHFIKVHKIYFNIFLAEGKEKLYYYLILENLYPFSFWDYLSKKVIWKDNETLEQRAARRRFYEQGDPENPGDPNGKLTENYVIWCINMLRRICKTLDILHNHFGIVHRDIRLENFYFRPVVKNNNNNQNQNNDDEQNSETFNVKGKPKRLKMELILGEFHYSKIYKIQDRHGNFQYTSLNTPVTIDQVKGSKVATASAEKLDNYLSNNNQYNHHINQVPHSINYDETQDNWCVGIIAYILMMWRYPYENMHLPENFEYFTHDQHLLQMKQLKDEISKNKIDFNNEIFKSTEKGRNAVRFIMRLLVNLDDLGGNSRTNIRHILEDPFIREFESNHGIVPRETIQSSSKSSSYTSGAQQYYPVSLVSDQMGNLQILPNIPLTSSGNNPTNSIQPHQIHNPNNIYLINNLQNLNFQRTIMHDYITQNRSLTGSNSALPGTFLMNPAMNAQEKLPKYKRIFHSREPSRESEGLINIHNLNATSNKKSLKGTVHSREASGENLIPSLTGRYSKK